MARLLHTAARAFGPARYAITDQGGEFMAKVFRKAASRLGIRHRLGSPKNIFATARLEASGEPSKTPRAFDSTRPSPSATWNEGSNPPPPYLCFRPHQGLRGATPAEAYLGLEPARHKAVSPPRGRPGEGPRDSPLVIDFLDPSNRRYPLLRAA
jgi:transposase InsO family protein